MRDAGQDPPEGVSAAPGGVWLVPVYRGWGSRSDPEASAYIVADNRHTELGGWDHTELAALLDEIGDPDLTDLTGWDPADLEGLLNAEAEEQAEALPPALDDPDGEPPGPARDPVSADGDLWILGPHRLLCGDATNPDHLDRLLDELGEPEIVYTDPPYGIHAVGENKKIGGGGAFGGKKNAKPDGSNVVPSSIYLPVAGDDTIDVARDAFRLLTAAYPAAKHVWWGGNHYAASAGLPDSSCWLVWDKENAGLDFADAELAWTNHPGAVRLLRHMWNGMVRASEHGKRVHPTQKPIALAVWAFEQVDPKAERQVVLDVFGGSGSTLLAANQTGRVAAVCEIEPGYVDVMCRRFQQATGVVPQRVLEDGTVESHDFVGELEP